ncbi:hypothetical protein BJ508DRAFT_361440 [Ascobolus immersus RN42]|uniref:Uncharacterized protein n=1 Tax=Ascobolus immersus RN42 TaxID=1160509 RepID=A0A3N4I998_ASCIM|nr:hypothetical protein BJ508DRAFT_361440 [Ascobolus immersus RN42]
MSLPVSDVEMTSTSRAATPATAESNIEMPSGSRAATPEESDIESDASHGEYDDCLFDLFRQYRAVADPPVGSKDYNRSKHRDAIWAAFGDKISPGPLSALVGPYNMYTLLEKVYCEKHHPDIRRIAETSLRFAHFVMDPALAILFKISYPHDEQAGWVPFLYQKPADTSVSHLEAVGGRLQQRPASVYKESVESHKSYKYNEFPHRVLIRYAGSYLREAVSAIVRKPEPNSGDHLGTIYRRYHAGLLRENQVRLIAIAMEKLIQSLEPLCRLCEQYRDIDGHCLETIMAEVNALSARFLVMSVWINNLIVDFLGHRYFRSERLESLLLRYLAEDGGEAGAQVAMGLSRIQATESMIVVHGRNRTTTISSGGSVWGYMPPPSRFCELLDSNMLTRDYHYYFKEGYDLYETSSCSSSSSDYDSADDRW